MIKCNIQGDKKVFQLKASGTPEALTKEAMCIIADLYRGIKRTDEASAEQFRSILFASLIDPNSPVLKDEDHG